MDRALALEKAREVLDIEIAGIAQIRDSLGDSFLELVVNYNLQSEVSIARKEIDAFSFFVAIVPLTTREVNS